MRRAAIAFPFLLLQMHPVCSQELALVVSDKLSWVNSKKENVIAEVVFADDVKEQRVGTLVDGEYLVSDNDTFHGQWNEAESQFVTKEYASTSQEHNINKRTRFAFEAPTENAWSLGLGYRGFKAPSSAANAGLDRISQQVTVKSQYQLAPLDSQTTQRLVLQREIGFTQVYWQTHSLHTQTQDSDSDCCEVDTLHNGLHKPDNLQQTRIGQLFLQPKDKAAREFLGIQSSKNLKPAENFLFFQGRLYTPAQISVLVNEQLRYSNVVNPGQIDLYNVPLEAGVNNVRVLVRQLDGSLREFSSTLNTQAMLLPVGESESDYSAGYNPNTRKLETHASYGQALSEGHTLRGSVSLDQQAQVQGETAHAVPWGLTYAKARFNEDSDRSRFELGTRTSKHFVGAEYNKQGWAGWFNGRFDRLSVNLKKALKDDFALAQISWTQPIFKKALTSASCSFLRSSQGVIQRYCGVSLNFLMLDNLSSSLSVSRSTGVQKGVSVQGAIQGTDASMNFLSSPNVDSISGRVPLGPFEGSASTDSLGGASVSLDATIAGQGSHWLGYGKKSNLESATLASHNRVNGSKVFYNGQVLPAGLATDVPLDVKHSISLDPESVPMDVDLESFTLQTKPRIPGVYVMKFKEATINEN